MGDRDVPSPLPSPPHIIVHITGTSPNSDHNPRQNSSVPTCLSTTNFTTNSTTTTTATTSSSPLNLSSSREKEKKEPVCKPAVHGSRLRQGWALDTYDLSACPPLPPPSPRRRNQKSLLSVSIIQTDWRNAEQEFRQIREGLFFVNFFSDPKYKIKETKTRQV